MTTYKNRLGQLLAAALLLAPASLWAGVATPIASQGGVSWQISAPNVGVTLRVSQPDGSVFEKTYPSGQSPVFVSPRGILPDGSYTYELRLAPVVSEEIRAQGRAAVAADNAGAVPAGSVRSGSFRVVGGVVRLPDASAVESGNNPSVPQDTFTDVIIQGNNTRLLFDDNSNSGSGFPFNDWELRANDIFAGGADRFSVVDVTGGTTPFTIRGAAPTDSLYVAANGNVGIATAVPAADLHIAGAIPRIRLEHIQAGGHVWEMSGDNQTFSIRDGSPGPLVFRIRSGAPGGSIDISAGGVGIGTGSPQGKLHVRGAGNQLSIFQSSDNMAVQFRLQTDGTNRRFVALNTAGTQQSQLVFGDNGAFDFLGATVNDVRMSLLANGNVGIGTATPTQRLSVNGSAGKPGGGSWSTFSDERLKNIKGQYRSGLEAILQLLPVRYEYKDDNALGLKSEGEHVGFSAAAVQKIIPEAVTETADGYLMVDNDPILWTMLNAIKEQNQKIEDQGAEIAELKAQNEEISELRSQLKRFQTEVLLNAGKNRERKIAIGTVR